MNANAPAPRTARYDGNGSAYERRWRSWYIQIADWLIAHPSKTIKECASALSKPASTIYQITSSDMFRDYLAQRRALHSAKHDAALRERLTSVAELGLDIIQEKLTAGRTQVPMALVLETTTGVLDRLGYGKPVGSVNLHVDNSTHATKVEVPASALLEARDSMRKVEQAKLESPRLEPEAGTAGAPRQAQREAQRDARAQFELEDPSLAEGQGLRTTVPSSSSVDSADAPRWASSVGPSAAPLPSAEQSRSDGANSAKHRRDRGLSERTAVSLDDFRDYIVMGGEK